MATFEVVPVTHPLLVVDADYSRASTLPSSLRRDGQAVTMRVAESIANDGLPFSSTRVVLEAASADAARLEVAQAFSSRKIDLSFDRQVSLQAFDASQWVISDPRVTAVSAEQVTPYVIRLRTSEMKQGAAYTIVVAAGVVHDLDGASLSSAALDRTASFTGAGTAPAISRVDRITATRLRVRFSEPMRLNAALRGPSSFVITPTDGGASVFVGKATPDRFSTEPTFVDIDITEQTQGKLYNVSCRNVADVAGNAVTSTPVSITGSGEAPSISRVVAVSKNRVDIFFDRALRKTFEVFSADYYLWDNDLVTVSVLDVTKERVRLVTSDQTPGVVYSLRIAQTPTIEDIEDQDAGFAQPFSVTPVLDDPSGIVDSVSWAFVGDLPDGLTVNASTGEISGSPVELGTFSGVFRAILGDNFVEGGSFSITVTQSLIFMAGDSNLFGGVAVVSAALDTGVTLAAESSASATAWIGSFNVGTMAFEWAFRMASHAQTAGERPGFRVVSVVAAADGSFAVFFTVATEAVAVKMWSRTDQATPAATFSFTAVPEQGYVAKYDADGVFQWVRTIKHVNSGGGPLIWSNHMAIMANGNLAFAESFHHSWGGADDVVSYGDPVAGSFTTALTISHTVASGQNGIYLEIDYETGDLVQVKEVAKTTTVANAALNGYLPSSTRKRGPSGELACTIFVNGSNTGTVRVAEGDPAQMDVAVTANVAKGLALVKYDSSLAAQWTSLTSFSDTTKFMWSTAIAIGDDGAIYHAGYVYAVAGGTITFKSAGWTTPSTTKPGTVASTIPAFIAKHDAAGALQWASAVGPSSTALSTGTRPAGPSALLFHNGFLYAAGRQDSGTLVLDEGLGSQQTVAAPGAHGTTTNETVWIAKIDPADGTIVAFAKCNKSRFSPGALNNAIDDEYGVHLEALGSTVLLVVTGVDSDGIRVDPGGAGDATLTPDQTAPSIGALVTYDEDLAFQAARLLVPTIGAGNGKVLHLRAMGVQEA